ncbi:MAG: DNA-binding response regulator [Akkermansiaceae bacterium]|nr:DNA-binding response regulator [Akkermansiaceae bacterium]
MQALHHADYARLLDFIAGLQEPVPLSAFGPHLVRLTSRLLSGAVLSFDQIHESTGDYFFDHDHPIDEADQQRIFTRLRDVYQQNPIYAYLRNGGTGPVVDIARLADRRSFERTDFYQDIFRPLDLSHQVNVLVSRPGWINTLTINRDRAVDPGTLALLELAAPHIRLAHRNACLLERLHAALADTASGGPAVEAGLTPRERQVFEWLREGKRNAEIAVILGCAPRTIDKHVQNILRKRGAETRTAAVRSGLG